ncbi:MAG: alpha-galactosidase [Bellilinea sp.]|jgi:alpha-galactosidase
MPILEHPHFVLQIHPQGGWFAFLPRDDRLPRLTGAEVRVSYQQLDKTNHNILSQTWEPCTVETNQMLPTRLGSLNVVSIHSGEHPGGLWVEMQFGQINALPFLLWRVLLHNRGEQPVWINRIELLRAGGRKPGSMLVLGGEFSPHHTWFYSNGWQSWSFTGAYSARDSMRRSNLGSFQRPMIINAGTPDLKQPGFFTSDFFGLITETRQRNALLAGFLSQREHFGSLEALLYDRPTLRLWASGDNSRLNRGATMCTDWAVLGAGSLEDNRLLESYLACSAIENEVRLPDSVPSGWCSWYHFYTGVTAQNVIENLDVVALNRAQLPLELIQIDDGFESQVGDWFAFKSTFPEGVAPLADKIAAAGLTPGLWLAPFIVHPKSQLEQQHPQWLLRNQRGRAVNAGFVWNTFTHALDLTIPDALDYACRVIQTAKEEWHFPYLKLDFLYAAALPGVYADPTQTRAQVLRKGMQALREAAGEETFLLGCGAPLGSVLGLVDAMRIGADVSGDWLPSFFNLRFPFKTEPSMPSARNSIHNILTRAPLHRRWWINDPDCLLVRPDTRLTLAEVQNLATAIALTGGSLLVSDDLPALPDARLRLAQLLLPVIGKTARVIDLYEANPPAFVRLDLDGAIGGWHLLARFNWDDLPRAWEFNPADFHLNSMGYTLHSLWDDYTAVCRSGQLLEMPLIPPHGVCLLAVYPAAPTPTFAGSNLHVSQGLEVIAWKTKKNQVELSLDLGRAFEGWFDINLEGTKVQAVCLGRPLRCEIVADNRARVFVRSKREPLTITIDYS